MRSVQGTPVGVLHTASLQDSDGYSLDLKRAWPACLADAGESG